MGVRLSSKSTGCVFLSYQLKYQHIDGTYFGEKKKFSYPKRNCFNLFHSSLVMWELESD